MGSVGRRRRARPPAATSADLAPEWDALCDTQFPGLSADQRLLARQFLFRWLWRGDLSQVGGDLARLLLDEPQVRHYPSRVVELFRTPAGVAAEGSAGHPDPRQRSG